MDNKNIEKQVSIIIPSRNIDYLLELCISKIRELYPRVLIIIVLDEINTEKKDNNIKILKSDNPNMSAKRNLGVKNTNTKYIAFIDSDAYPNVGWLENGINFLEKNDNYFATTGCQLSPSDDNLEQQCLRSIRYNQLFTHKEWCITNDIEAEEQDCIIFTTANAIIRKNEYEKLGGMNEKIYLAEDNEFANRARNNGFKTRFIPTSSIFHRECTFYPYFRKLFTACYYYVNNAIKGKLVKPLKEIIQQMLPLFGIIIFFILWYIFQFLNISAYPLLILPLLIATLMIKESINESKRFKTQKTKATLMIFYFACIYCLTILIGTVLGLLNIPIKNIKSHYKHY